MLNLDNRIDSWGPMRVDIPKDMEDYLLGISKKLDKDPKSIALQAIQDYLEDQHDYHTAVDAYHAYLKNGRKSISLEELEKDLGM